MKQPHPKLKKISMNKHPVPWFWAISKLQKQQQTSQKRKFH